MALVGYVEKLAEVIDEQIDTIGLKHLVDQRSVDFEVPLHVGQRPANLRQVVVRTDGVQDVRFDQVEEGERRRRRI